MHLNRTMDGRKCYIYLPTDRKLELTVHPKQLGKDLYDIVVSELKLKERDYFGLTYKTTGEHYAWLQDDKKVLDHDMQLKATDFPLEFLFSMKFYEDSVTVHKYPTTVEIIFLHVRNSIYEGDIDVSSDLSFELAALCLQAVYGDYTCDEKASSDIKNVKCLPYHIVRKHSPAYCEERICSLYMKLNGTTKGQAVLYYLNKAEKLSNFGVHYYQVKDKGRIPWWLGISNKGICQYNFDDKSTPQLVFQWRNLENLYFREKKFSVEVCSGHRRTLSTGLSDHSKKSSGNTQAPKTYAWYGTPSLIKSIWIMAIAQHQFYWDRKQSRKNKHHHNTHNNNTNHLRAGLDNNANSLLVPPLNPGNNNMPKPKFHKRPEIAIPEGKPVPKTQQSPEMKAVQNKMVEDLKRRKLDLEDRLYDKVQELKAVCQQELDLTERIPIEYLRYLLPSEEKPVPRKKVKTEFTVTLRRDHKRLPTSSLPQDPAAAEELQQLEADCDLLNQITKAAYKLAHDPATRGRSRRKRLESYQKSLKKLQDVEIKIDELRKRQGKKPAERQSVFIAAPDLDIMKAMNECSLDDKSERSSLSDGMMLDDETSVSSGAEALSTHSTPALTYRPSSESADVDVDVGPQRSKTPPPTKLAWYESPRSKNHHGSSLSPNGSYPVLPSPGSHRSSASHSSGMGTPPRITKRDWIQPKWEHPRHRNAWKVSSLDSLESIGSRQSTEHGSDMVASPSSSRAKNPSDIENANAKRIAKALESPSRVSKVSLREGRKHSEPSRRMGTVNPVVEIVEGTNPDSGKDSRTSLTDSGHVTSSETRLQASQEDTTKQKHHSNTMRRDVSDSSLSELSTQSNPAALPSSGHHPKFYPFFMSRPRARTQAEVAPHETKVHAEAGGEQGHVRKRSSSFTESGSNGTKVTLHRDNLRTLSRSKTHHDGDGHARGVVTPDAYAQFHGAPNEDGSVPENRRILPTSKSANELPPPMFDTNLNICRQYLSGSQGHLTQDNLNKMAEAQVGGQFEGIDSQTALPDAYQSAFAGQAWSDLSSANPANVRRYEQNVSVNNSNNKLNFGQIYKMSQGGWHNPDMKRMHSQPNHLSDQNVAAARHQKANQNVPKSNSLDSVLDSRALDTAINPDTVKNYSREPQYHANEPVGGDRQFHPVHGGMRPRNDQDLELMTNHDRDRFNNEAFEEIRGMAWVPSLDEYGSRASVAESLPAKSKKEDIMQLLQQHIAHHWRKPSRTPSTSSAAAHRDKTNARLRAKLRAEILRDREAQKSEHIDPYAPRELSPNDKTWEGYKRDMQTMKRNPTPQPNQLQPGNHVNIFRHNPPPPPRHTPDHLGNQPPYGQSGGSTQQYSQSTLQRQVHKGYVNPNGFVVPLPANDPGLGDMGYHQYPAGYNTVKPKKSAYPTAYADFTNPSPFERNFHSATLPRHYSSPAFPLSESNHSVGRPQSSQDYRSLPRQHSNPVMIPDQASSVADFYPVSPHREIHDAQYQRQLYRQSHPHSSDYFAPAPLYTSPPRSVPSAGDARNRPDNYYNQPQSKSGYRYQVQPPSATQSRPNAKAAQEGMKQSDARYQALHPDGGARTAGQDEGDGDESESKPRSRNPSGTLVIQSLTTSPDGHKVSVFSLAKSAPNTPLPERRPDESSKGFLSGDENDQDSTLSKAATHNSSKHAVPSPFDSDVKNSKQTNVPSSVPKLLVSDNAPDEFERKKLDTDASQAMAIEAAREAQKSLKLSHENLLKFEAPAKPPALPLVPPNSSVRTSRRGRRQTSEIPSASASAVADRKGRDRESRRTLGGSPHHRRMAETPTPQTSNSRPRSRSRNRKERNYRTGDSGRRTASPGNSLLDSIESSANTTDQNSSHDALSPPSPFQRTFSTPTRIKPLSLSSARREQRNSPNKTTGMLKESVLGPAAKSLPPTGSKTPIPPLTHQRQDAKQQGLPRTTYRITQSGTLPRMPKASKKVERAGSTTGQALVASMGGLSASRSTPVPAKSNTRQFQTPQYYNTGRYTPRRSALRTPQPDDELKYKRKSYTEVLKLSTPVPTGTLLEEVMVVTAEKPPLPALQATRRKISSMNLQKNKSHRRSMSETWTQQQPLTTMKVSQHHSPVLNHPHHMYHHLGHHGMMPTGGDMSHEAPRRTASADDLLWSPDAREQTYSVGNQQGTLV